MPRRFTTEYFITRANKVHDNIYDYSLVVYLKAKTYVDIICNRHGTFKQTPDSHLKGRGCPICGGRHMLTLDEVVSRSKGVHGDLYDYSKVVYQNIDTEIEIICKKHGSFLQIPYSHMKGHGCRRCAHEVTEYARYKDKPTVLYVVDFGIYNGIHIIKIGVTQSSTTIRFRKQETKHSVIIEIK